MDNGQWNESIDEKYEEKQKSNTIFHTYANMMFAKKHEMNSSCYTISLFFKGDMRKTLYLLSCDVVCVCNRRIKKARKKNTQTANNYSEYDANKHSQLGILTMEHQGRI